MVLNPGADSQQPNASPLGVAAPPPATGGSGSSSSSGGGGSSRGVGGAMPPLIKPLHNFPLEDLKWSMSHSRIYKTSALALATNSPSPPAVDEAGAEDPPAPEDGVRRTPSKFFVRLKGKRVGSGDAPVPAPALEVAVAPPPPPPPTFPLLPQAPTVEGGEDEDEDDGDDMDDDDDVEMGEFGEDEEEEEVAVEPKTWNLRPRKAVTKPPVPTYPIIGVAGKVGQPRRGGGEGSRRKGRESEKDKELARERRAKKEKLKEEKREKERLRRERMKEERLQNKEKEGKQDLGISFNISLTKEEIEMDFLAITGSKPPRRPQKRPRNIQKELDSIFPGLDLNSITTETYKVDDPETFKPRK